MERKVSVMSSQLIGSEIIKLAAEVNEKIKNGVQVFNLTIGDFNPKIFPIPAGLKKKLLLLIQMMKPITQQQMGCWNYEKR